MEVVGVVAQPQTVLPTSAQPLYGRMTALDLRLSVSPCARDEILATTFPESASTTPRGQSCWDIRITRESAAERPSLSSVPCPFFALAIAVIIYILRGELARTHQLDTATAPKGQSVKHQEFDYEPDAELAGCQPFLVGLPACGGRGAQSGEAPAPSGDARRAISVRT